MGCLVIALIAAGPRIGMGLIWLFTDWVDRVFNGWVIPLLGIVLAPWTTMLYTIGYIVGGDTAVPWGIMGAIIGVFLDVMTYASSAKPVRNSYQGAR
jgi:hypothetical protein